MPDYIWMKITVALTALSYWVQISVADGLILKIHSVYDSFVDVYSHLYLITAKHLSQSNSRCAEIHAVSVHQQTGIWTGVPAAAIRRLCMDTC